MSWVELNHPKSDRERKEVFYVTSYLPNGRILDKKPKCISQKNPSYRLQQQITVQDKVPKATTMTKEAIITYKTLHSAKKKQNGEESEKRDIREAWDA